MINSLKALMGVIVGIMSWIIILFILGFVMRINFEIFMLGWGVI